MPKQTFVCDFGDGITCTTVVNHTRLFQGKNHVMGMQWSAPLTWAVAQRIMPAYREWLHSINLAVVNKTRRTILYCLQIQNASGVKLNGTWELWVYAPDQAPKLEQVVEGSP